MRKPRTGSVIAPRPRQSRSLRAWFDRRRGSVGRPAPAPPHLYKFLARSPRPKGRDRAPKAGRVRPQTDRWGASTLDHGRVGCGRDGRQVNGERSDVAMSQPIRLGTLSRDEIHVDKRRVGISYSGGGPLVLVELGCAKAFIECGIRPVAIAGVSAGALAGAAHALDPVDGAGIDLACELLADIHRDTLALGWRTIAWRLLRKRTKFT